MIQKQFGLARYTFKPGWLGTLILLLCVPIFIKLGLWQYHKAVLKQQIQMQQQSTKEVLTSLPSMSADFSALQYKNVRIKGKYITEKQILLDNQVEASQAGFHVVTPLKIDGTNNLVLVNRGWIAGSKNRNDIPTFETPSNNVEVVGQLWIPSKKIFTLESGDQKNASSKIWQHLDMARYQKSLPNLLPVIIKLDEKSTAGGFVRHWQMPESKIASHFGYAYQWFGFAVASIFIYMFVSFKKRNY
ncbi:MAG TPA: SURF1 family protein [Methylotenera sp.]|nr:SURF1 family protein [Methylotenera sp.]HPH05356.1 SURF1 family protein [Methylotenera sp.]HPN01282.1 SURF1 family protein [Methylotenera sp.]